MYLLEQVAVLLLRGPYLPLRPPSLYGLTQPPADGMEQCPLLWKEYAPVALLYLFCVTDVQFPYDFAMHSDIAAYPPFGIDEVARPVLLALDEQPGTRHIRVLQCRGDELDRALKYFSERYVPPLHQIGEAVEAVQLLDSLAELKRPPPQLTLHSLSLRDITEHGRDSGPAIIGDVL